MCEGAQLSWGGLNICLTIGSGKLISCFVLLACMAFILPIELFISTHDFFHFYLSDSPPISLGRSEWEAEEDFFFLPDGVIALHGVIWLQGVVYVPHTTDCATIKKPSFAHLMSFLVEFSADTVFFFFKVCSLKTFPVEICHLLKAKNSNVMPI